MRLFDWAGSKDVEPADFSEPAFAYLNQSDRPIFQFIREYLEEWFANYPPADKAELRARFRSSSNQHHNSAFFELLIHELLRSLECQIEIHPALESTSRSPDFLIHCMGDDIFYVEATVATYQSDDEAAADARLNQLYDVLNRHVDSTNFFISIEINSAPENPPPARSVARFLNSRLRNLDPDEVTAAYESEGYKGLPLWVYKDKSWSIILRAMPKKPDARGKPGVRPLGMFSSAAKWVDHRTPLRDAIADKASAYGDLRAPYVVAVNALEMIDEIDVMEALFGKEQFTVYFSQNPSNDSVTTQPSRIPDGLWMSGSGPTNTRVSAVLIASRLRPWSIGESSIRLYHNPWAASPYRSALTRLPQAIPNEGRYNYSDGESLLEIFGLDWPGDMAG